MRHCVLSSRTVCNRKWLLYAHTFGHIILFSTVLNGVVTTIRISFLCLFFLAVLFVSCSMQASVYYSNIAHWMSIWICMCTSRMVVFLPLVNSRAGVKIVRYFGTNITPIALYRYTTLRQKYTPQITWVFLIYQHLCRCVCRSTSNRLSHTFGAMKWN